MRAKSIQPMRLNLSSRSPRNSTYSTEWGQVLYKVNETNNFKDSIAIIRKAVNTVNGVWQGDLQSPAVMPRFVHAGAIEQLGGRNPYQTREDGHHNGDEGSSATQGTPVPEGLFAFCAQVDFRFSEPTRFYYEGLNVSTTDYFRKEGRSAHGRGRVFRASDGKEYRWQLSSGAIEMIRNDESKERVVNCQLHRPSMSNLLRSKPPSLEVDDRCIPILDEIIMTFIYFHKLQELNSQRNQWSDFI